MLGFVLLILLAFASPSQGAFGVNCNVDNGHLAVDPNKTCWVGEVGTTIYSITLGENSVVGFQDYSVVTVEGDVEIPQNAQLTVNRGARLIINGHLSVSGTMSLTHCTLEVQDSLLLRSSSNTNVIDEVTITAQDFTMEEDSTMIGDHASSVGTGGLGFSIDARRGGSHASTSSNNGVFYGSYFKSNRPTPHGSVVAPRHAGSPGTNVSGGVGGKGGAAIRITVENTMILDGEISSNGQSMSNGSGGGAGGSIDLTAKVLKHSSGVIRANGGTSTTSSGGGGGGGRVAIKCLHSEFADVDHATTPLGVSVQANGNGQGPGTIWYDCGAMRTTLVLGEDTTLPNGGTVYVNVEEFQDMIVREIRSGRHNLLITVDENRTENPYTLRYGTAKTDGNEIHLIFAGAVYPRSHPNPNEKTCFDYRVRSGCSPQQETYAVIDENIGVLDTTLDTYFPQTTVIEGKFDYLAANGLTTSGNLIIRNDMTVHSLNTNFFQTIPDVTVVAYGPFSVSDTFVLEGRLNIFAGSIDMSVNNFHMGKQSVLQAITTNLYRHACNANAMSYAGCPSGGTCHSSFKPYGAFYDVVAKGTDSTCSSMLSGNGYSSLVVHQKFSMAGKIMTRTDSGISTGGAIKMDLNEVVHMSGTIDISGAATPTGGTSAGRAMVKCNQDTYHSMFHLKIKADGGCVSGECGATGTVYLDCGYYKNYLKVVTSDDPPTLPSPTHIIIDKNYVLDTIEISQNGYLYFTSANSNSYTFEVKRVISPAPPRIEKASTIRLKLGQTQPPTLPTATSINNLISGYETLAAQRHTQLNQLLTQVDQKYLEQLSLLENIHKKSTEFIYCSDVLALCQADECAGQSTRFTRTGRERVEVRMNVDTFKNPLDVRTARDTLIDTLANFYDIPKEDILASDPVESGTRVLNITLAVDTEVAGHTKRVLLEKSSRIEDSPVESCFKRVNL